MNDNIGILEAPACGRLFQLGSLYNAQTDKLIQGNELWDKNTLQKAQQDKPYVDTQFTVIQDDSLTSKFFHLGADRNNVKVNLLTGLTHVSGAAKFLTDHKSSSDTVRVSVQFKYSSHIQEVNIHQLGQIQNQAAIGATRATHVVAKVLFGLEAFLVVDYPYSTEEDLSMIQKKVGSIAQIFARMYESRKFDFTQLDQNETEKYRFQIFSDLPLPSAPSTLVEVISFLEQHLFNHFKQGSNNFVPQKVWLYPLNKLDKSAPFLAEEVSDEAVNRLEKITEKFEQTEVCISDVSKLNTQNLSCSMIPFFQEQQTKLVGLIKKFRGDMAKLLATKILSIRNGSGSNDQLSILLKQIEDSPFGSNNITSFLKGLELEVGAVSQFLNSLVSEFVKCITSDEIDALAIDFDNILSFEFRLGGTSMASLNEMEEFIRTKALGNQFETTSAKVTPWYKDGSKKRAVQIQAKLFKEFVVVNSERDDIAFVVHFNSDIPSPSKEGAAVVLYTDDEPTEFDLPSKPLKLRITKDTGKEVHLAWNKPKYGQANVISYTVTFFSNSTPNDMTTLKTEGATEAHAVQDLAPDHEYGFIIQAECSAGLSPKSETLTRKPYQKLPIQSPPDPKSETAARTKPFEQQPIVSAHGPTSETKVKLIPKEPPPVAPKKQKKPVSCPKAKNEKDRTYSTQLNKEVSVPADDSGPIVLTLPPRSRISPQLLQRFEEPTGLKLPPRGQTSQSLRTSPAANSRHSGINEQGFAPTVSTLNSKQDQMQPFGSRSTIPSFEARQKSCELPNSTLVSTQNVDVQYGTELNMHTPSYPVEKTANETFDSPKPKNVTHESISLEWEKPLLGNDALQYYTVLYNVAGTPGCTLSERRTGGAEQHITINGLSSETGYIFRIQATFFSGAKKESESTGTIRTKANLPDTIRRESKLISESNSRKPALYELPKTQVMINHQKRMAKYDVGQPIEKGNCKVLMVVGATGAGKTTLINGIANYMYGVQWKDDFRFVLVANEPTKKSQAHSQTSWITAYTLYRGEGSPIRYSLTIIDTPGFGDTEGVERDKKIADQIKEFFSVRPPKGIDILHGIGFVAQSSLARLSPSQKYIFDSILSIYGRDVASNIFMMTTFADGQDPPVMEAIKVAKIPHQKYFKFNNSALFVNGDEDSFDAMFWKMGKKSFQDFFSHFGKAEHRSLQLTREVLSEREQLENCIKELQPQIHAGLTKMDELKRVVTLLRHNKNLIEQNKDFIISVPVTKQRKVDTPRGQYTTNCLNCNYTCHDNCAYADNEDKKHCCAMRNGNCTICPESCNWSKHVNNPYIFELYEDEEVRTSQELKDRYDTAKEGESRAETMIANIKDELNTLEHIVLQQVDKARRSLIRLDEIALKPNPLSEVDYIDQLIVSEEQQVKLGWQERVAAYKALRKRAELMRKIKDSDQIEATSLFSYLGEDGTGASYQLATVGRNPGTKKHWYQFWKS